MPKTASCLLAIVLAFIATECFLRCIRPFPLFYSAWFTSGIHEPDTELGFRFVSNFHGQMRHEDGVYSVPLSLDAQGFRVPHQDIDSKEDIVILGGASMSFCYGLTDEQTIATVISRQTAQSDRIQTISWPGFDLPRDVLKLKRWTEKHGKPDRLIVCLNRASDLLRLTRSGFFNQKRDASSPKPTVVENQSSKHSVAPLAKSAAPDFIRKIVIPKESPTAELLGDSFYRSYCLAGIARHIEYLRLKLASFTSPHKPISETPLSPHQDPSNEDDEGLINQLRRQVAQPDDDSSILVVILPSIDSFSVANEDTNFSITSNSEFPWEVLDLRGSLQPPFEADWIASGHYGPHSAARVGKLIAEKL